jgi:hypothetical protein
MANTQDKRAPEAEKIAAKDKPTISTNSRHVLIVAGPAAARPSWLKPMADYERKERREFQVTRFG